MTQTNPDLPAYYWSTTFINTKKNRKKSHYKIPKKFAYKQLKGETTANRSTNK